jgi:hypothetical protein
MRAKGDFRALLRGMYIDVRAGGSLPRLPLLILVFFSSLCPGQIAEIPPATPLSVQLAQHVPMKKGQPLDGHLLYPVYVDNHIALPAGTQVRGRVTELVADRSRRIHGRLRGDFTPFHIPVVRFDELVLADGSIQPIVSENVNNGAPILRLSPPPGKTKGSLISRQIALEKQRLKDAAAQVTAPGRGDRLVQFLYTQLPYHPQRIESGTAWVVDLTKTVKVMDPPSPQIAATKPPDPAGAKPETPEWRIHAYLRQTISSSTAKAGDKFEALVSEPIFNTEHVVEVPQGSLLIGEITRAKAARSFARQGKLRFRFRELRLPNGFLQPVEGTLTGVDSDKSSNLQMDSEGAVQPKTQNRVILPLALTLLATHAFDDDGNLTTQTAFASNGFGIMGRIAGIAAGSRNVAAGIGLYGASLAIYDLWLAHGKDVTFVKDTRIEVTTTPSRNQISAPPAAGKSASQ